MGESTLLMPSGSEFAVDEVGTSSIDSIQQLLDSAAGSNQPGENDEDVRVTVRHKPLVTTRIGSIFIVISLTSLVCGTAALAAANKELHSLMWIATIAASALGGMLSMRSARTLRVIESELRRATGEPSRWQAVRPIIGSDSITEGWNELLEQVAKNSVPHAAVRAGAALDHEVVTLARAMRGLPVCWVITDLEARIRFLSPAACGLFGLSEEANQAGRDLADLLGLRDEHDETAQTALAQLLSDVRMVHQRRDLTIGTRQHHLRITRSRLDGRAGDGEGLAWILTDTTQQQKAIQARDQFLMTATHELRTPLNNLHAYAEALLEENDLEVEKQKEFCNVILSEATRLGRMVDQLLMVGQMEAGSMLAHRHELEIVPVVQYAVDHLKAHAAQKNQSLETELSAKLPTVFGDRDKLQAALVNVVGNAVKYTPAAGEVIVRSRVEAQWILIEVQDSGPGIPEDEQDKVFQQFYRGQQAQESEERGNGLGLAFAREVAKIHGGSLELQSRLGNGSTFTFRLPIGGQSRSAI